MRRYNLSPLLDFVSPAYIQALLFDVCKREKLNVEEEVPTSEYPNTCVFQALDPIWVTSRFPQLLPLFGLSTPHFSSCCICKEQPSIYILWYFLSQVLALPQNSHDLMTHSPFPTLTMLMVHTWIGHFCVTIITAPGGTKLGGGSIYFSSWFQSILAANV